jgi:acyl-CoA synthetase (AMP-forming)/AMP-acid ligase II
MSEDGGGVEPRCNLGQSPHPELFVLRDATLATPSGKIQTFRLRELREANL